MVPDQRHILVPRIESKIRQRTAIGAEVAADAVQRRDVEADRKQIFGANVVHSSIVLIAPGPGGSFRDDFLQIRHAVETAAGCISIEEVRILAVTHVATAIGGRTHVYSRANYLAAGGRTVAYGVEIIATRGQYLRDS